MRILICSRQASASSASSRGEINGPAAAAASSARRCCAAIDHRGKMPSDCRSPATSATGALTVDARARLRGGGESREQQVGLAVAGETRETDDLALMRHELVIVSLSPGRTRTRTGVSPRAATAAAA